MTTRALQETLHLWTHYREVNPVDEYTDWMSNLQVCRKNEGTFLITVVDNVHQDVACHEIDAKSLLRLVRWLQDGPDRADA